MLFERGIRGHCLEMLNLLNLLMTSAALCLFRSPTSRSFKNPFGKFYLLACGRRLSGNFLLYCCCMNVESGVIVWRFLNYLRRQLSSVFFLPLSSCRIKNPLGKFYLIVCAKRFHGGFICVVLLCECGVRGHCLEMLNYLRH